MKRATLFVSALVPCIIAAAAKADFVFGTPINLGYPVNTSGSDGTPHISKDGLSLYFTSNRSGGSGSHDLWMTTRASKQDPWSSPTNLGPQVNSSALDYFPCISVDGLSLCFYSARPGGRGGGDLWMATRSDMQSPWNTAVNLGGAVNSPREEVSPNLSDDGLVLMFSSDRAGGYGDYDLYVSTRASAQSTWSAPVNFGPPVNGPHLDVAPSLSSDGLILFFHSIRPEGRGSYDLYYSRRQSVLDEWSAPVNMGSPINSSFSELGPSLMGDGSCLYWSDHYVNPPRPGGLGTDDIWQSSIEPIVDLNADGIVDSGDMCIMVGHWDTADSLCDIGPMPWGDGIVDVEDLKVLAEHLFEDIDDPTLVAHWALDEAQGTTAYDSAADYDGTLVGDPVWLPDGGQVNGALECDGIDDFISAPAVLNSADGPFSFFVWIKGGAPGQVVLSQADRMNWMLTDPVEGCLVTELASPGRSGRPLQSQTVITDGNWHRIALVWDGSHRRLYVDGVVVAEDEQDGLGGSYGGLYIGTGSDLEAGTFFSGLIDDVRIYNRAIRP